MCYFIPPCIQEILPGQVLRHQPLTWTCRWLCDRVCFIYNGKVYATDTPDNLIKKSKAHTRIEFDCSDTTAVINSVATLSKEDLHYLDGKRYCISTNEPSSILSALYTLKKVVTNIDIKKPTLDDAYYKITGESMEGII